MRIFIVVAKSRPDLFSYFKAAFAGVDMVEVIMDRRLGRDGQTFAAARPGPHRDRRTGRGIAGADIYDELDARGFVIVRLPTSPRAN
jgi:hypothetical protein